MKKTVIKIFWAIVCAFSLSACFFSGEAQRARYREISDSVVDSCYGKKKDNIKNVFAPNIVNQVEDFDEQVEKLTDYLKGDFESYEYRNPSSTDGYYDNGKRQTCRWFGSFIVHTTITSYYLSFYYCNIDDFDKNNVGVIALLIQYAPNGDEEIKKVDSDKWDEGAPIEA